MPNARTTTLTPYKPYLGKWNKGLGSKPTKELLDVVHERLEVRPGSKAALALAMYLRPEGATSQQVATVCGTPQNNKRRELIAAGELVPVDTGVRDDHNHLVYRVSLPKRK